MQRRDFLKISAVTGATAALDACGNPEHQLIRFIPEEDLVPGIATWKPSICTLCPAGCGMLVRVMQGEAEVVRNGKLGLIKMGLAKKLEGNPNHPISQGKLCPRGQAGLQVTYHPDRIQNPLARTGPRGSGQFKEITWDEAIKQLVAQLSAVQADNGQLLWVTQTSRGERIKMVRNFTSAFGGLPPIPFGFFNDEVIRFANSASFDHTAPPTVDLGQSNYVVSFGADFLGTWNSPVAQSVAYGKMRKGRAGSRGKFVHVEPRMSLTAANADEWIPCKPGTEGLFALAMAHVIIAEKMRPAASGATGQSAGLIEGWSQGLPDYAPDKVEAQTGIPAATITRIAREAAAQSPAVAIIGDAATAHTNSFFNAYAVNALNALLGSVGKPGGLLFGTVWDVAMPKIPPGVEIKGGGGANSLLRYMTDQINSSQQQGVRALFLDNSNPVFATPRAWRVREAFEKIPFIASFGNFIDETSALADLILPDHSPLESWLDDAPLSGSGLTVASLAPPAMNPLHNTRAMPDVLLEVARLLGGDVAKALPWKNYEEQLKAAFSGLQKEKGSIESTDADDFWKKAQAQGGWWSAELKTTEEGLAKRIPRAIKNSAPEFDGAPDQFPFYFLPFASQMFYDGSLAHLPWMQEAPDPLSSVMWGTWIEINTQTAAKMDIKQGDMVEVASQHGTLRAPAMVVPGIAPDVVAMPVGQGHENFTRYASGRGANPISILAPMTVAETGSLAWAATRVKISRVGEGNMVLFGGSLREQSPDSNHR